MSNAQPRTLDQIAIDQTYMTGYQRGLSWPDAWDSHAAPGGPFVYNDFRHPLESAQSRAENDAWCRGWRQGHVDKLLLGRKNTEEK